MTFCVLFPRYLANFISYFKLLAIALIVTGQNPFQILGTNTPRVWSWGQENKVRNAAVQAWVPDLWNYFHVCFWTWSLFWEMCRMSRSKLAAVCELRDAMPVCGHVKHSSTGNVLDCFKTLYHFLSFSDILMSHDVLSQ